MTLNYAGPQRTWNEQRVVSRPVSRPISESPTYRAGRGRPGRPYPTRPVGAPMRYRGTGVGVSNASHARRPVTLAQAAMIPGVSPSDLQNLVLEVERVRVAAAAMAEGR